MSLETMIEIPASNTNPTQNLFSLETYSQSQILHPTSENSSVGKIHITKKSRVLESKKILAIKWSKNRRKIEKNIGYWPPKRRDFRVEFTPSLVSWFTVHC